MNEKQPLSFSSRAMISPSRLVIGKDSNSTETRALRYHLLTGNSHPITPIQHIPDHGPIGQTDQGLGVLLGHGRESIETAPRPTQDQGLEAGLGHGQGMRHPISSRPYDGPVPVPVPERDAGCRRDQRGHGQPRRPIGRARARDLQPLAGSVGVLLLLKDVVSRQRWAQGTIGRRRAVVVVAAPLEMGAVSQRGQARVGVGLGGFGGQRQRVARPGPCFCHVGATGLLRGWRDARSMQWNGGDYIVRLILPALHRSEIT